VILTCGVPLSLNDLASAGIGFDIAGALLLAKGLLVSAKAQWSRNVSGWGGYSFGQIIAWAEDWVDAVLGASSLAIGFALQAADYALITGGLHVRRGGIAAGLIAVGFAVVAGLLTVVVWRASRRRLVRSRVIAVSRAVPADGRPSGYLLAGLAKELSGPFEREGSALGEVGNGVRRQGLRD
jgi:hypothetical protein